MLSGVKIYGVSKFASRVHAAYHNVKRNRCSDYPVYYYHLPPSPNAYLIWMMNLEVLFYLKIYLVIFWDTPCQLYIFLHIYECNCVIWFSFNNWYGLQISLHMRKQTNLLEVLFYNAVLVWNVTINLFSLRLKTKLNFAAFQILLNFSVINN